MQNIHSVLVVGATGFLGGEVCAQLLAANKKVKAIVRSASDPSKVQALKAMGIETTVADIKNPGTLQEALDGVDAVISTASSTLSRTEGDSIETVDLQGQLNLVHAAAARGIQQFIYISFLPSPESFPLQDAKRAVEQQLLQSGINYTILRPTFFTEVWLGPHLGFDAFNGKVTVYGNGNNKISFISLRDVAAFAVASLDNPEAVNRIIELGGPEALSPAEVIAIFEQQAGRKFEVQYVPEEAIRAQHEAAPDSLQRSFSALMLTYAAGAEVPMKDTLQRIPVKLTSVKDYSRHMVAKG